MTGINNVIQGIGNFFVHLLNSDSILAKLLHKPIDEWVAYEKAHGKENIEEMEAIGLAEFTASRAAGHSVGDSIKAAVSAVFNAAIVDVKTISTQGMTFLLAGVTK